jgi:hypothetical protein
MVAAIMYIATMSLLNVIFNQYISNVLYKHWSITQMVVTCLLVFEALRNCNVMDKSLLIIAVTIVSVSITRAGTSLLNRSDLSVLFVEHYLVFIDLIIGIVLCLVGPIIFEMVL